MAWVEVPPIADRPALKDDDEEERAAEDCGEQHYHADDPDMHRLASDPQQEEADRDFEERGGQGVEDLAKVPELSCPSVACKCYWNGLTYRKCPLCSPLYEI